MNRRWLLIIILIFTFLCIGTISFLYLRSSYNRHVITSEKWNQIQSTRKEDINLQLSSLKFQDVSLLYDSEHETYYYSYVDSSKKFNPSIFFKTNMDSVKLAFSNKITLEKVENNSSFEMMIYNDSSYHLYHLVVTGLPILNFDFSLDDSIKKNSIEMTLYDNRKNSFHEIVHSLADVFIMDSTTDKKDFTFSLLQNSLGHNERENNISILGMNRHSEYVLNSMSNDSDMVRNIFTTNLWNEMDRNTYEKYQYVELFLNHQYYGLYTLGYNIEKELLRIGPDEFLFYKNSFVDSENDYSSDSNLEGYVLYNQNIEKIPRKEITKKDSYEVVDAWDELKNAYQVLFSDDIPMIKNIGKGKNTIDTYLFYLMIQSSDHVSSDSFSNTYIIFRKNNKGYRLEYLPWNLNDSFGVSNQEEKITYSDNQFIMNYNPIARLIELKDEDTIKEVKEEYQALRKGVWSNENLLKEIDSYEKSLFSTGAYYRDSIKWEHDEDYSNDSFLAVFKTYVKERLSAMDYFINEL